MRESKSPGVDVFSMSLVGAILGYGLDGLAGTSPWLFITFFVVGFCAALWRLIRCAGAAPKNGQNPDH